MLRKILFFVMVAAIILDCGLISQSVSAQTFSLTDLSYFSVSPMSVYRSDKAVCDGTVSLDEYEKSTTFREGSGLYLLNNGSHSSQKIGSSVKQENFVLLSGDEIYCAIRLQLNSSMLGTIVNDNLTCYRVSFSIGLTPGDHPALRGSLLTNTYYFSSTDYSCVGFNGERKARSVKEKTSSSKPLSTYVPSYLDNGFVSSDGVKWNGAYYCENASFSVQKNGELSTVIFESRVPLEDALLSVHPSQRDLVRKTLRENNETLCGAFSTAIDLNSSYSLVTGLPADLSATFSSSYETVRDWIRSNYEIPVSGEYIPSLLPIPLYWCGQAPKVKPSTATSDTPSSGVGDASPAVTTVTTTENQNTPPLSSSNPSIGISDVSRAPSENDESIFDSLPDADDLIPEDTEIVYASQDTTAKEEEKDNSLTSSILATLTGAFLFASVMVLCLFFRDTEKRTEATKKKKRKNDKKNKD